MKSRRAYSIRLATSADIDALCGFADEFLKKMHLSATGKDSREVFKQVIRNPKFGTILVAQHQNGLCAYAYASYQWRSESGGECMDLVEIFVDGEWRNKGVGVNLVSTLIKKAKARGIRRVVSQVHSGNATIEHMLDAAGFDPEHRTIWAKRI